jgi:RNA polymerase sigma-70 factor (ECF subfamily)
MITFHDLYQKYAQDVYRFSFWLSGSAMEAEDITAETFTRAWTSRSKIRTETVKAYLFTIARNLYLEQQRKAKRFVELKPEQADPQPQPEKTIEHRLDLQMAQELIQSLPETDRTVFLLRVQHDLPYAEIARVTNLSLSAVKVKVHRVRLRLAEMQIDEEP